MNKRESVTVLGVRFDSITMSQAVERSWELMEARRVPCVYVVTPNPEIVMMCREDPEAAAAVAGADLSIPDGIGIVYGAKIQGTPIRERLPGIDFTTGLLERMDREGKTLFLLGGKPGVAEAAAKNLKERYPGLKLVGTNDGYFQDDAPILEKINTAAPDLLLVCLGAPKQEKWMRRNAPYLKAGLMIGAGGSIDVFAGTAERAPEAWQKAGLEWLYRLKKEPKRITRMAVLPKFLLCVMFQRKK